MPSARARSRGWLVLWIAAGLGVVGLLRCLDTAALLTAQLEWVLGCEGWKIVGLTRLSPVFPFNLLNYAFGITRVRLRDYVLASWIGMMPGTAMYAYLGSLVGDVATLGAGRGARSPAEWSLCVIGLLATVAVTVYVTRLARAALARRVTT